MGLSQLRLAALVGCAIGTVSAAERSGTLTPALAEKLAGALGLDAEELLK
jgi:transcriptional regulator with XRE-family HTH domain